MTHQVDKPKVNELVLEIEELQYGNYCKGLLVSTGKLAKIYPNEISNLFISQFCHDFSGSVQSQSSQDDNYLKQILTNLFNLVGYQPIIKYMSRKSKISLQKVLKAIEKDFTFDEW